MKHFALWMAIVGLAATGCAQSRVFGPHARRGGADFQIAQSQAKSRPPARAQGVALQQDSEVQQASYGGGRCRSASAGLGGFSWGGLFGRKDRGCGCCDEVGCGCDDICCDTGCCDEAVCGCPDPCCDSCSGGCADGCAGDGCCGDGSCGIGGGGGSCGLFGRGRSSGECSDGCSACGGRGCGLCQRVVGQIASGCCPHSGGYPASYNYNPSPPTGQVAYPYYTVRGPRDFLRNNPPSIGPY